MFKIIFLTSSKAKLMHLAYLFRDYDVEIVPPPDYGKPYVEPRIYDRDRLLEESIKDANQRLARNKSILKENESSDFFEIDFNDVVEFRNLASDHQHRIFFIEDTSVVIDALSKTAEVPGVDIKYWMREHDFSTLDSMLKRRKNVRTATVRSDIVLYLPPGMRDKESEIYKVFTGQTRGEIVRQESVFEVNPLYPWLDNKTFNKWFVPEGASDVISRLPVEESLLYDFRQKAIREMIFFLDEKNLVRRKSTALSPPSQIELFPAVDYLFCGPTCSGKTVLAFFISKNYGYRHIEASDFMRKLFNERHGINSAVDVHDFAKRMLDDDPGIVANKVADYIVENDVRRFIVTGFRNPKEIEVLSKKLNRADLKVIYIDSPIDTRFERSCRRARADSAGSYQKFLEQNSIQRSMGLLDIKPLSMHIENDAGFYAYLRGAVREILPADGRFKSCGVLSSRRSCFLQLENIILLALFIEELEGRVPLTTAEVSRVIKLKFSRFRERDDGKIVLVNKNNVSRFFNQRINIHFKAVLLDKVVKYQLSQTGKSAALAVLRSIEVIESRC